MHKSILASLACLPVATYFEVNKLIDYICDRVLVEIQMGHEELVGCKTI